MLPETVSVGGRELSVWVQGTLDDLGRLALEHVLSDPEKLDRRCRAALLDPSLTAGDGSCGEGQTELYVHHHQEQMALPPDLADAGIEAFVRAMAVHLIWVTPDGNEEFLHVDYTIDAKRTQYVLSVALGRDGVTRSVRMER